VTTAWIGLIWLPAGKGGGLPWMH